MGYDPTILPRDPSVTPLAPAKAAELLRSSAAAFEAELSALGDELAHWRPGPDEWCATEVVGHVIEADKRGFGGRIARMLDQDGVVEHGWDQVAVARERRDATRPVADVIAEFRQGREAALEVVARIGPADLPRRAQHDRVGEVTIADLLGEWVYHDRNHLRQLLLSAQARVWPVMGNARRFVDPSA
jgi:hypothetical protein